MGGYPISGPGGVPHLRLGGVPHLRSRRIPHLRSGVPNLRLGGTPSQVGGVPHLRLGGTWGTPLPRPEMGYPPPPDLRWGIFPIAQSSIASTCYTAGGVPLAFTQEDCLVLLCVNSKEFTIANTKVCTEYIFDLCLDFNAKSSQSSSQPL